jgi:hypothetical protein
MLHGEVGELISAEECEERRVLWRSYEVSS